MALLLMHSPATAEIFDIITTAERYYSRMQEGNCSMQLMDVCTMSIDLAQGMVKG